MFRIIRLSEDCKVVVVAETANGGDGYSDPNAKFHEVNGYVGINDFREISPESALMYFSGQADGMGFGEKPEQPFESLDALKTWQTIAKEKSEKALVRTMMGHRGIDTTNMSDEEVVAKLKEELERIKEQERADIAASTRPGKFRIIYLSRDRQQAFAAEVTKFRAAPKTVYRLNRALTGPRYCMSTDWSDFENEVGTAAAYRGVASKPKRTFETLMTAAQWRMIKDAQKRKKK